LSIRARKQFKQFDEEFQKQQEREQHEADAPIRKAVSENEDLLRQIDTECQRAGVTRQAWIKMVCAEWLWQRQR